MHVDLGGYHVGDVEFTAAFDVTTTKVGRDLADAIWAHPNDTIKFADVPTTGIKVSRGMTHDGIGKYLLEVVDKAPGETDDVVGILRETQTDVVVNYLPVGSEMATKWYVEQILDAGCAMVNCMPVFLAREPYWQNRFEQAGVPIIGDDIKSQVGATITHRVLTSLFRERGVRLDKTMQLNVGGNSDFLNMLERERLESKKISKTNAVTSMLDYDLGEKNVHVGPSDYVPWLTDRKWAYIRMEGSSFGDVPLNVELKLEVWDSPNSAGIVIDAVRLAKLALDNGVAGALEGPSAYLMKSPPKQIATTTRTTRSSASSRRRAAPGRRGNTDGDKREEDGFQVRGARCCATSPGLDSTEGCRSASAWSRRSRGRSRTRWNEHVEGVAASCAARPSRDRARAVESCARPSRPARAPDGSEAEVIAVGPAVPISRRSQMGVPVGVRANLALALERGRYDVVHGFEPGLPSLSYLALRDAQSLSVASFFSPDRLRTRPERAAGAAADATSTRCSPRASRRRTRRQSVPR